MRKCPMREMKEKELISLILKKFPLHRGARRGDHSKGISGVIAGTLPTVSAVRKQDSREECCVAPRLARDSCIPSVA